VIPALQLADELFVREEGNVVDSLGRQYRRWVRKATVMASSG
jgi:hypothetical protein